MRQKKGSSGSFERETLGDCEPLGEIEAIPEENQIKRSRSAYKGFTQIEVLP